MSRPMLVAGASLAALAAPSHAADGAPDPRQIVVTGALDRPDLDHPTDTASRLGLSVRETPATIEVLTQEDLQVRGLRTSREAFADVTGAIAGNVPGNPAVVSLRGFSGAAVSILQDGVRVSTSTVVTRDVNTWHYDRIEVLKGPASVLYGEGALAGVINKVTRKPVLDGDHMDALLTYGSFRTLEAAGGVNLALSDTAAIRADASYQRSDSLYDVDDNDTRSSGLTASLLWKPATDLSVLVGVDHFADRYGSSYQGAPLVAAATARDASDAVRAASGLVLDRALRHENYNPAGATSGANETTARTRINWRLGGGWSIADDFQYYWARRDFVLSGDQNYTAPDARFPRGSFARSVQRIFHDQRFWTERLVVTNDSLIADHRNRFSLGGEYDHTFLFNPRQQSPVGAVAPVDPYDPVVGAFPMAGVYTTTNVVYRSKLEQLSVFAEDALNLTPRWLLVGGARYDRIDLDRTIADLNRGGALTQAHPRYHPFSWRVGTTWDAAKGVTLYAQYTTAAVPVSSILLQSIANAAFRLTTGRSAEGGVKASLWGDRLTATASGYWIEQNDILTRDPADPTLTVQGGSQSSRGGELTVTAAVTPALQLTGGASYTAARYNALTEVVGGVRLDRAGNRPINIPSTTLNATALYTLKAVPLTIGAFVRHASGFYTDTANTIFVRGRTTLDASLTYRLARQATLTLRGRNLTDAFYGEYSGYPTTNVYVGAPRSVDVALATHF